MNAIPINTKEERHPSLLTHVVAACVALIAATAVITFAFWLQRQQNAAVIQEQEIEIEAKASYIEALETELEAKQTAVESMPDTR